MTKQTLRPSREKSNLLNTLLSRGDSVTVERGGLKITPYSGKAIPSEWYKENERQLVRQLCQSQGINAYRFDSFTTGYYSVDGNKKSSGLTLLLSNVVTGETVSMLFNANIERTRNTKAGKKGARLPGKKFTVSTRYEFYKFWIKTGLNLPPSLSKFHEYMGNLRQFVFTGELKEVKTKGVDGVKKLSNKTVQLFTIKSGDETIMKAYAKTEVDLRKTVRIRPQNQSNDEWLSDWESS